MARRKEHPYDGRRFLLNNNTDNEKKAMTLHDLDNEKPEGKCQIDKIVIFSMYDDEKHVIPTNDKTYTKCIHCMPEE